MSDIHSKFDFKCTLGSNPFGKVVVGALKTNKEELFAIKCLEKKRIEADQDRLYNQVAILRALSHPNIVQLHETFEDEEYNYLVLDLASGGELFDKILERGRYSEQDASQIIAQILSAVGYMHKQEIVHRDLRPEKLLCLDESENPRILVSAFALAQVLRDGSLLKKTVGYPAYAAPEVSSRKAYDLKADMWSIGVISYILLCGYPPFRGGSDFVVLDKARHCKLLFDSPNWDVISASAKDFISKLIRANPKDRYDTTQALLHPWIEGDTASVTDIHLSVTAELKLTLAKQKWTKAVNVVGAVKMMQNMRAEKIEAEPLPPKKAKKSKACVLL